MLEGAWLGGEEGGERGAVVVLPLPTSLFFRESDGEQVGMTSPRGLGRGAGLGCRWAKWPASPARSDYIFILFLSFIIFCSKGIREKERVLG